MADLDPAILKAAGLAMATVDPGADDLFEWHHCEDTPACHGATQPCACSGIPWPSAAVRAALAAAEPLIRANERVKVRADLLAEADMADTEVMSLCLDPELSAQTDLAAQVLEQNRSDFIRDAIRGHLARIKAEAGFQQALEHYLDRHRRLLAPEATP